MAWVIVNQQVNNGTTVVSSATINYTVISASNTIVVCFTGYRSSIYTVSIAGLGATWTTAAFIGPSGYGDNYIFVGTTPTAGAGTITLTYSQTCYWAANTSEWSGGTSTVDVSGTSQSKNSPSLTTTVAGDLIVAVVESEGPRSYNTISSGASTLNNYQFARDDTGFTNLMGATASNITLACAYKIQYNTGAVQCLNTNPNAANNDIWTIAALEPTGGSGANDAGILSFTEKVK